MAAPEPADLALDPALLSTKNAKMTTRNAIPNPIAQSHPPGMVLSSATFELAGPVTISPTTLQEWAG